MSGVGIGRIGFVGLGMMGLPMATRLVGAGFSVTGCDLDATARDNFAAAGGAVVTTPAEAGAGVDLLIAMLPDGAIVRAALLGPDGALERAAPGLLVVDMSSCAPLATRALGDDLAARGVRLVDAPVSGGVRKARAGTLSIMAGGAAADVAAARPAFEALGASIFHVGPLGAGHASKALNNYVSAAGLAAMCRALLVAERFGMAGETLIDVLDASTGRNNSTEVKARPFILPRRFESGFALALMAKDVGIAADLAAGVGLTLPDMARDAALWKAASAALGRAADHTAIFRYLETAAGAAGPAEGDDDER